MPNDDVIILLVEDNPDDEVLTLRAFKRRQLSNRVVVAHDGVEALDYLLGHNGEPAPAPTDVPHLVLLDLKLPRIDGLEVLRRLRENARTRLLPVVVLTSSDEERDIVESYGLGANSYIRKPVEFDAFSAAVSNLGTYWLALNELPTLRLLPPQGVSRSTTA